jgi:hypothetical protein
LCKWSAQERIPLANIRQEDTADFETIAKCVPKFRALIWPSTFTIFDKEEQADVIKFVKESLQQLTSHPAVSKLLIMASKIIHAEVAACREGGMSWDEVVGKARMLNDSRLEGQAVFLKMVYHLYDATANVQKAWEAAVKIGKREPVAISEQWLRSLAKCAVLRVLGAGIRNTFRSCMRDRLFPGALRVHVDLRTRMCAACFGKCAGWSS